MKEDMEPLGSTTLTHSVDLSSEGIPPPKKTASDTDYIIAVINMTNVVLTKQRMRVGTNAWTSWFNMQPIPRTCNSGDPQKCFDERAWVPVTTIGCGGPSFELELRSNKGEGAVWSGLYADCQRAGGVVILSP